ncbi:hypothetical protein B5S33_g2694 [[Candida] boidinii]|nr:hypothetical protein B5S33_g2694 [[Candida] boidinii]
MDYQNRVGSKKGSGGVAGAEETNQQRRERLRELLTSKIDIENDPYVFRNHLGMLECRLCLTTHVSEGSYITHTQGKKHHYNLLKRAELDKRRNASNTALNNDISLSNVPKKSFVKIGRPAYKVTKIRDPVTYQKGLRILITYKNISESIRPRYRFLSSYEQKIEAPDNKFQYLVVSGEPYENIAYKVPSDPIDMRKNRFWDFWDKDTKEYYIQFFYKDEGDS